ncbi:MAG: hypothetical protein DRI97_16770, partial [Bacteroidetes bacterium]
MRLDTQYSVLNTQYWIPDTWYPVPCTKKYYIRSKINQDMRIVILADPLDNQQAGIHHYTRNLITHLAEIDKNSEYFILRSKKDDLFPPERQIVVKSYPIPGHAAWRMFIGIPYRLRKLKPDLVVEPAH